MRHLQQLYHDNKHLVFINERELQLTLCQLHAQWEKVLKISEVDESKGCSSSFQARMSHEFSTQTWDSISS